MSDSLLNWIPRRIADINQQGIVGWRGGSVRSDVDFTEFMERVAGWRALLAPLPGPQFALYLDDRIEFAAALFGAWYAGKTVWLAADATTLTVDALKQSVDGFLGNFSEDCSPVQLPIQLPVPIPASSFEFAALDGQFTGLVVHTSGTTGAPQAILKKLSQLATEVATLEQLFGAQCGDAEIIATVSHQHIYGLLFSVLWPLAAGRAINASAAIFPETLAEILSIRASVVVSSPAYLKRLPVHLAWGGKNNRLRAVFSSGGVLPKPVAEAALALLGHYPLEIFGSSETGGIAWRKRGSGTEDESWLAMPGVLWRSAPDSGQMAVKSPHLPDDTWFTMADCIVPQKNGRFILKGRCDRIVKIEEKRISLDLIAQQITTSPFVSEVKLVVFNGDVNEDAKVESTRQYLGAVIIPSESGKALLSREGKQAITRQIKTQLMHCVPAVGVPRRWRYVDEFPLNSQGKLPEARLMALLTSTTCKKVTAPRANLLHRDENKVEFELVWPSDLIYFEGHFPGVAVLPGVVQIDWAIKTGRDYFGLSASHTFCAIHALKFQQVIFPDSPVNLIVTYSKEKQCLDFSYFSAAKRYSSGRILLTSVIS